MDGIFWGQRFNYLSRDQGKDRRARIDLGEWFGLDSGPFVTLAFYAETHGDLRPLFIVREIDNVAALELARAMTEAHATAAR